MKKEEINEGIKHGNKRFKMMKKTDNELKEKNHSKMKALKKVCK